MCAKKQVAFGADSRADLLAKLFGYLHFFQRRLAGVKGGIGPGGIKLQAGKAHFEIFHRPLRRRIGVGVNFRVGIGVLPGLIARIKIGVAAQPLVHLTAQQRIDGLAGGFAYNIPQRTFQPGKHTHQRNVGPHRVAAPINVAP